MHEYDFKNKTYDIIKEIDRAKTDPEVALWFTNHMTTFELTKVFTKAWAIAMDEKEMVETK